MNVKKTRKSFALCMSFVMTAVMLTAHQAATVGAAEFLSNTYFYGFDDSNSLPSGISTRNVSESEVTNGIWSVTGDTTNTRIYINQSFSTDTVSHLAIRMKTDLSGDPAQTATMRVYFKDANMANDYIKDGVTCKVEYSGIPLKSSGYATYTLNLSSQQKYASLSTISTIRIDIADKSGRVDIDYIMLKKEDANIRSWSFDSDADLTYWKPFAGSTKITSPSVSGGLYTQTAVDVEDRSDVPRLIYSPPEPIYTTDYDAVEVIMKHEYAEGTKAQDKALFKMFLTGTNYSSGTPEALSPNTGSVINTISETSGENFYRYVFNFNKLNNDVVINDAKITQIRIDSIRDAGTYYIDSIRLIPKNYADMADVGGHEEGSDDAHINMGFTVETEHISDYNSIKVKVNTDQARLIGGYDLSDVFGNLSGPVSLGIQINEIPTAYENAITVELSSDNVGSVASSVITLE